MRGVMRCWWCRQRRLQRQCERASHAVALGFQCLFESTCEACVNRESCEVGVNGEL